MYVLRSTIRTDWETGIVSEREVRLRGKSDEKRTLLSYSVPVDGQRIEV